MSSKVSFPPNKGSFSYDAAMVLWRIITQIFFREVRPRGAFHIPPDGPVIFVGAPHSNQACTRLYFPLALSNDVLYPSWLILCY